MKKLRKIEGSCAVCALHYISGIDEETVLRVCTLHGFSPDEGMDDDDWQEAAEDLGIKIREISMNPCQLKKFIKNNPRGLFLLGTWNHLFAVDNGVIIDPRNPDMPGLKRVIKQAWRVYNGPKLIES